MDQDQTNEQQAKLLVLMLKNIAKTKGITQQQIADKTGLLQSNVARIFSLKYNASLPNFLAIAKAIDVNFFFEDKEEKTELTEIFENAMTELGRRVDSMDEN